MIALVNPPSPPNTVSNKDMMGGMGQLYPAGAPHRIPPLDLPYCAAVLRQRGMSFTVIDCLGAELELGQLLLRLAEQRPDFVAVRTSTPTFDWDRHVARLIKLVTAGKVILFGSHVGLFPHQAFEEPSVDAIVVGEAELA